VILVDRCSLVIGRARGEVGNAHGRTSRVLHSKPSDLEGRTDGQYAVAYRIRSVDGMIRFTRRFGLLLYLFEARV
jgi:hypothetical protein